MNRVHAARPSQREGETRPTRHTAVCQWCGASMASGKTFCAEACRTGFNNLRKERGALVIDLLMCLRFDRALAQKLQVWSNLCTMLSHFRTEDHDRRQGRKSWMHPMTVIQRRPDLFSKNR